MVGQQGAATEVVVPGANLRSQYRSIKADIDEAIRRVAARGHGRPCRQPVKRFLLDCPLHIQ